MKSIAIVGTQLLFAFAIMATGAFFLAGSDVMVQRFAGLGLGEVGRIATGAVQIGAGLCLLLPRGQVVGAALLAALTIGVMGAAVGHFATGGDVRFASMTRVPQFFSAVARSCDRAPGPALRAAAPRDWAI
jgi:hypothetical protein